MNFQQLRIIRETVRQNFNLTEVASALFASQSGVSKHIKTYVALGMGVGIVSSLAIDPQRDQNLCVVDGEPLFGYQTARIAVRRGHYLRSDAYRFISLCSSVLDEASVRQALSPVLQE